MTLGYSFEIFCLVGVHLQMKKRTSATHLHLLNWFQWFSFSWQLLFNFKCSTKMLFYVFTILFGLLGAAYLWMRQRFSYFRSKGITEEPGKSLEIYFWTLHSVIWIRFYFHPLSNFCTVVTVSDMYILVLH